MNRKDLWLVVLLGCAVAAGPAWAGGRGARGDWEVFPTHGVAGRVPDGWTVLERIDPPAPGWFAVAAVRCDRDRDGNRELVVAFAGGGGGALVWLRGLGDRLGPPEKAVPLDFEPAGMVAGDLDADGREELGFLVAGGGTLAVAQIGPTGDVLSVSRHRLPVTTQAISVEDRPQRDGLPDLVLDAGVQRLVAASPLGALEVLDHPEAEPKPARQAEAPSAPSGETVLLETRIDRDALPEKVVAMDDGMVVIETAPKDLIVVATTADTVDFGGSQQVADLPGPDGVTSLREAIIAANNTPPGPHMILFNIPQTDAGFDGTVWTIHPTDGNLGPLPAITMAGVTIDGTSQTDNQGDTNPNGPEIVLDGSGCSGEGFNIDGADSAVIDLVIHGFTSGYGGIQARGADNLLVIGCYLGTLADGTTPDGNSNGVRVCCGATNVTVGGTGTHGPASASDGNLISGNLADGIWVGDTGTTGTVILGNTLGLARDGSAALGNGAFGIEVTGEATWATVGGTAAGAGNVASGNGWGIEISGIGTDDTLIQGNRVGTSADGLSPIPNAQVGIEVADGPQRTTIGGTVPEARNLVSGNASSGIRLAAAASSVVQGNWIGLDATGGATLGNGTYGLEVDAGCTQTMVGGSTAGAGNVASGNAWDGVAVHGSGCQGTTVLGNILGLDVTGTTAIGNGGLGLDIMDGAADTVVGGAGSGEGNVMSGNSGDGLGISGAGTSGTVVRGNLIGTDVSGLVAVPNVGAGVRIEGDADQTTLGGTGPGEGNVISGNGWVGVYIGDNGTDNNQVLGNLIGLDQSGEACLGNTGEGVYVNALPAGTVIQGNWIGCNMIGITLEGAGGLVQDNHIGVSVSGTVATGNTGNGIELRSVQSATIGGPGHGNEIANSGGNGILVKDASADNTIRENSIHDNGGLAIDLNEDGVTPNDAGDGDDGPNHLVNFPVIAGAVTVCGSGQTTVTGTVDSPIPDQGLVEIFGNDAADPSGYGEAKTPLGTVTPAADGSFTAVLPEQPLGSVITATFTDSNGNTSELCLAATVVTSPLAPSRLHAELSGSSEADLSWTDNASDEDYFRLERRKAGDPDFTFLANLPANTTSYHDAGPLEHGTAYYYRIRASGGGCTSDWSNQATLFVPPDAGMFCPQTLTHHRSAMNSWLEYGDGFFGATWREVDGGRSTIWYAKLDATGSILSGPVQVTHGNDSAAGSRLVWNGSEWGHLWYERMGDEWGVFFQRLDGDGNALGPAVRVDGTGIVGVSANMRNRGLAWDGSGWGVVWRMRPAEGEHSQVGFAHLDATGVVDVPEVQVDDGGQGAAEPQIQFNGTDFGVVWIDYRANPAQFFYRRVGTDGSMPGASVQVTSAAVFDSFGDLVWNGSEYGLCWNDDRDGDVALYFMRFDVGGAPLSTENRISDPNTPVPVGVYDPTLRFAGDRWVVASEDYRNVDPNGEIQLSFADLNGDKLGSDVIISGTPDGIVGDYPALAWNGTNLLALWQEVVPPDSLEIHAQATDVDGNLGANPQRVLTSGHSPGWGTPGGRWTTLGSTGNGFAAVSLDWRAGISGGQDPFLSLAAPDGSPNVMDIQVADSYPSSAFLWPSVASSGETMAVAWVSQAYNPPYGSVFLSLFDLAGNKVAPDILVSDTARLGASVIWAGGGYLVAWDDYRDGGSAEIYTARYDTNGNPLGSPNRISQAPSAESMYPKLAGDDRGAAVVWADPRDGNWNIYGAPLDAQGRRAGPAQRITSDPDKQLYQEVAWNGSEYYTVWTDYRDTATEGRQVYGVRLGSDAAPVGGEVRLSDTSGVFPNVVWDGSKWVVAWLSGLWYTEVDPTGVELGPDRFAGPGSFAGLAFDGRRLVLARSQRVYWDAELELATRECLLDATPPTCPTELHGTSGGGTVSLDWTPGTDDDGGVWWQAISRDGRRVAVVEPGVASWTDSDATEGAHRYTVTTLNQAALESQGCENVSVYASASCLGSRTLQATYQAGVGVPVTLDVAPPGSAAVYAVQDAPPAGWTVSDISDGGSWDAANSQVKWIFYDNTPRSLTYTATPPGGESGQQSFSGRISVDGASQDLCGDTLIDSGPPHPADGDDDWTMEMDEVTAYAAAWRNGETWPEPPNPIPIEYVTNASYLWLSGETYHYEIALDPPYSEGAARTVASGDGTALCSFSVMSYSAGQPFSVTLSVNPNDQTLSYAVEDAPPAGWAVSDISDGGTFDSVNAKVKWGPFFDNTPRTLTYTVTPPDPCSGAASFAGTASFDGNNRSVGGARTITDVAGDVDCNGVLEHPDQTALLTALFGGSVCNPDVDQNGHVDAVDLMEEVFLLQP